MRPTRFLRARTRRRDESGATAIELVLYMPLLVIAILLTVQFCLIYLGNQAASAAAREAARVARVTGDTAAGQNKGYNWANDIGRGILDEPNVRVDQVGDRMRAVVRGHAVKLLPFLPPPEVSETVEGPIEQFVPDVP